MSHIFNVPDWFIVYSIGLELLYAIITLAIGLYAGKLYRASSESSLRLFSISFLLISLSYFIQAFITWKILGELSESIYDLAQLDNIRLLNVVSFYSFIILFTIGLITLVYMTFKEKNIKLYWLMVLLTILGIIFSINKLYAFRIIALVVFVFLSMHFFKNYAKNKNFKSAVVLLAFICLTISNLIYLFATHYAMAYVEGHIFEFIGYLILVIHLFLIDRKCKRNARGCRSYTTY